MDNIPWRHYTPPHPAKRSGGGHNPYTFIFHPHIRRARTQAHRHEEVGTDIDDTLFDADATKAEDDDIEEDDLSDLVIIDDIDEENNL